MPPSLRLAIAVFAASAVALTACGDDDDTAAPTAGDTGGVSLVAFCDDVVSLETAPAPEVDWESASEDEIAAAAKTWASSVFRPLVGDVVASAPDELADEAGVLSRAVDQVAETGDFGPLEDVEVEAAGERFDAFTAANCGWASLQVAASEYEFQGVPSHVAAGVTRIELVNEGAEMHELALARRNDGVTQSVEDLLALPEDEALQLVAPVGSEPIFAEPGETESAVFDLVPGRYIVVCFIPVGTTSFEDAPPDGEPHAFRGMVAEFTVE